MKYLKKINLDDLWQKEQGWNEEKKSGRKFDDVKELSFWRQLAPYYSDQFNLYRDVPGLKEKIFSIIGEGESVIDLGCGTGNFTIPLAAQCNRLLALNFSPAMLFQLTKKINEYQISNVSIRCTKWEDFNEPWEADYVLSVNSLYRVCYMGKALKKISEYGKKGFIIVRTLQQPLFSDIYEGLHLNYRRNNDYMLIPLFLWDMGIQANVEYMDYTRTTIYENMKQVKQEMIRDLGEMSYMNFSHELKERFLQQSENLHKYKEEGFLYRSRRIVQVIWCKF